MFEEIILKSLPKGMATLKNKKGLFETFCKTFVGFKKRFEGFLKTEYHSQK